MSETTRAIQNKPRPLWPWVVAAVLLCLFAVGFSFWWRIQQAQRLVKFASRDNGHPYIDHLHPPWMNHFIDKEAFLPWYDHFYACVVRSEPISDELFQTLCKDAELGELALDISNCTPETIAELENQPKLSMIELNGRGQEIPLDWLKSMPWLNQVLLNKISVPPDRWPDLLSFSRLNELTIDDGRISIVKTVSAHGYELSLNLAWKELSQTEADAITAIPDLKRLTLEYSSSTPEFWQTLSRHPKLETLTIAPRAPTSRLQLTGVELQQIQKMPTLSELRFPFGLKQKVELETEARKQLNRQRPDVLLIQFSSDR